MFERASVVIRDGSKLSFEYVPAKLVHREGQMGRLETLFRPMVTEGRQCSAFLTGSVGTGKTVTAKRFCEDMAKHCAMNGKPMDSIFINCRIRNSEYGVMLQMLRHFDAGFPDRGFSADEMLRAVKRHIEVGSRPLVVILDEVDMLLKNNSKNLIYQLSRLAEDIRGNASVSLILISQDPVSPFMDNASASTFKRANTIRFDRYTRSELRSIAEARSEEALIPGGIDGAALDMIADLSQGYGDARFAIEILERSALIAEENEEGRITPDDVRSAGAMIYSDVSENKLLNLDLNHRLALLAISRAIKKEAYVGISSAEKTYAVVCEEYNQVPRKHTQFWKYIQNMENLSLISTEVRSEPDGGRTTYISIQNIPPKELAKKLEYILDSDTVIEEYEY